LPRLGDVPRNSRPLRPPDSGRAQVDVSTAGSPGARLSRRFPGARSARSCGESGTSFHLDGSALRGRPSLASWWLIFRPFTARLRWRIQQPPQAALHLFGLFVGQWIAVIGHAGEDSMSNQPPARTIQWPSKAEAEKQFESYTAAVGAVVHAWNYLHERLGDLFIEIVKGQDKEVVAAIWHSTYNDRAQRQMLESAINAMPPHRWLSLPPTAKEDLVWLLKRINELSVNRNDAVHAPVTLLTDIEGTEVAASPMSGHRRAKNLVGKRLLIEFDWCERYAEELSRFANRIFVAMLFGNEMPWPNRPCAPNRKPITAFPNIPRRRLPPGSLSRPPRSSPA
jgi:hypothetical protein